MKSPYKYLKDAHSKSCPSKMLSALIIFFLSLQFSAQVISQSTPIFSPIRKDASTNLYAILIYLKTPLQPSQLHLDLGSYIPWFDCSRHYKSSTYQPVIYNTSLCLDLNTHAYSNCFDKPGPGCSNDTCDFAPENPITRKIASARILTDKFALPDSLNSVHVKPASTNIVLGCTWPNKYSRMIYKGLARGSTGLASLGRFNYSLSAQISRGYSSLWIFSLCLPASSNGSGIAFFNSAGPYRFSPKIDASQLLIYTPLIQGPVGADTQISYWYKSPDYYIGLRSFRVNGKEVPLNQSFLVIDELGKGGTRLSTSRVYSVLHTTIFNALAKAFVKECDRLNYTRINPVEPFRVCYAADKIGNTRAGPAVPAIDLVLDRVNWRLYGSNSMVRVEEGWCLGLVDGGTETSTPVVIGGHQLQDHLLQFDLERQRLGFASLLQQSTSCDKFSI